MDKVIFRGLVLPRNAFFRAESPPIDWFMDEHGVNLHCKALIENSAVTVEIYLDKYEPIFLTQMYKRAIDLSRMLVNMISFATGKGMMVLLETATLPNGSSNFVERQEPSVLPHVTAFSLALGDTSFGEVFPIVATDFNLFAALDDIISAITHNHTAEADCGRAIERLRHSIAPNTDKKAAWKAMNRALGVSQEFCERVIQGCNTKPTRRSFTSIRSAGLRNSCENLGNR
jgi:hypothetical protein